MLHVERLLGIGNMYEPQNVEWNHHIQQSLKAHAIFMKDKDYVVKDGEVIIVDEFTGRLMPGRRWSDGLHQAVEAKEGVKIERENQTLATVTFQNYFRMYKKLSGMTGTAESGGLAEFEKIYKLEVTVADIPTRQPALDPPGESGRRLPHGGREVPRSAPKRSRPFRSAAQPILVGTISVEKSERMSALAEKKRRPARSFERQEPRAQRLISSRRRKT